MAQGVSRFSTKFFCLTVPNKISRVTLLCCVSEKFRQPKSLWIRGGGSIIFFSRHFFFAQCRKNWQGNPSVLCFRRLLVAKIFMDKKRGISRVSVENILSDSAENFCCGNLQCVNNFGYRKISCFRGLCNDFLSKKFCLIVPKHFVVEPFCAVFQKISGSKKVYRQERGGSIKFFLRIFFRLTVSKNAVGFSLVFQ